MTGSTRLFVCRICYDPSCKGLEDHNIIKPYNPFENCRHKWIIEEGGKHCLLCKAIVYDRSISWIDL